MGITWRFCSALMLVGSSTAVAQNCPWDCETPRDGVVATSDFLAVLGQWGQVGTSCDFFGDPGVATQEFLQVLGFWGVCPPPANDDCTAPQAIPCPPGPATVFVPFATAPATASGASSTCLPGGSPDLWYCLTNISGGIKDVTVSTSVGGLGMEVLRTCTCPPAVTIGCTLDAMTGVSTTMLDGETITIRLANLQPESGIPPAGNLVVNGVPVLVGACCDDDQNCLELTQPACLALGDVYLGDGTTCVNPGCPAVGACCFDNGTCSELTEQACGQSGGSYQGDDTLCSGVNCDPTGACCQLDTSCFVATESECDGVAGFYQGNGTDCSVTCPVLGACCFNDTTCLELAAVDCGILGGTYVDDFTACNTVVCPLRGACCLSDGSCIDVVPTGCVAAGGIYQGDATDCFATTCVPFGACCFSDAECQILSAGDCLAAGGFYEGDSSECTEDQCHFGCGSPLAGSCLIANFTPGCDDYDCCDAVCTFEPLCCIQGWDVICAFQLTALFPEECFP